MRRCAPAAVPLPLLDSEFNAIAAELQTTNLRSATELRIGDDLRAWSSRSLLVVLVTVLA